MMVYRVMSVFFLMLALQQPVWAIQTEALNAQSRFLGRGPLSSPSTGIAMKTPRHFRGAYDKGSGTFFLKNRDGLLLGLYALSDATLPEMEVLVVDAMLKMGFQLKRIEKPSTEDQGLISLFETAFKNQSGLLLSVAKQGPSNNALVIVALGKTEQQDTMLKKVKRVMSTVEWSQPIAQSGGKVLAGTRLESEPGAGEKSELSFCSDGHYRLERVSETEEGRWRLVSNLIGEEVLMLKGKDKKPRWWRMNTSSESEGQKSSVKLNGTRYRVTALKGCPATP